MQLVLRRQSSACGVLRVCNNACQPQQLLHKATSRQASDIAVPPWLLKGHVCPGHKLQYIMQAWNVQAKTGSCLRESAAALKRSQKEEL